MTERRSSDNNKNRYIYACLAGVIVIFMYLILLRLCRITPFGDNTWVMYDLKRQYIDFYSYYKRVFAGEGSLFYSFETALGSGMIGFFVYYLNNPLFLIFNFFRPEELPNAVTLVIGITLVLASVIMALFLWWYLKKSERKGVIVVMGAVSWAFCGFMIAHGMNMMWTDVVILLPVVIYATEQLLGPDKPGLKQKAAYVISVAFILLFNYYISYQVLLYVALWTLVHLWVRKEEHPVRKITDMVVCTVIPVLLDAVVLLPTLLELANSPKDITRLGMEATGKMLTPLDVFSKIFIFAYDEIQPRFGLPQVYAGILILIPAILYFFDKKTDVREKIGRLILLLILFASFCIDAFNLFWHALMEPSGHPYRQAPLFVFTIILCAADHLKAVSEKHSETDGSSDTGSVRFPGRFKGYIVSFILIEVILVAVSVKGYTYTGRRMFTANEILILAGLFGHYLYSKFNRPLLSKMIMVVMPLILSAELVANAMFTYPYIAMNGEKMSTFREKIVNTENIVSKIKASDSGFYRMESLTPRQQNEGMMYGYNGVTHYSSAGMTYVRYLLQKLGFNDDALYTHYGHDNTVTMDMLLGIKYVITEDDSLVHHDYVRENTESPVVHAYRNPYALSVATGVKDYDLEGITDIDDPVRITKDPFALQEDMVGRLAGHEVRIFNPLNVTLITEGDHMEADLRTDTDGEVYMYLDGLAGISQGLAVYKDDEFVTGYGNLGCYKILNLGYHDAGDNIRIEVRSDSDAAYFGTPIFVTEDMDSLRALYNEISQKALNVERRSSSSIKIGIREGCSGIVTSIPYEEGWNTEAVKIYGALMYIPFDSGNEKDLELRFLPKGMQAGMVTTLVAVLFCMIYAVVNRRKRPGDEGITNG